MKKLLLSLTLAATSTAATLDISGWQQERNGRNIPVKITGVAAGELPFFSATAGTVESRKIVTTDIENSTLLGRSLLSAQSAATARAAIGVGIGQDVQAYDLDLDDLADGSLTGSKVGTGINAANITTGTLAAARMGSGTPSNTTFLRGDGIWSTISSTGIVAADITDSTILGRGLLKAANFTDAQSFLLLRPGIDIQAYDDDLADLADGSLSGAKVGSGFVATNITSGQVPLARLGTGTPDNSTFLRGDGSWAAPPAGAGEPGAITLPETYIPYGSPTSTLTSSSFLTYSAASDRLFVGGLVNYKGPIETPSTMAALAVDLTKALNTKSDNASRTITFDGTLADGQYSGLRWTNTSTSSVTITLPAAVYSGITGELVSTFTVPGQAGSVPGRRHVVFSKAGSTNLIYAGSEGSGPGSGFPLTANADFGGFDANNIGTVSADSFSGIGTDLTELSASELVGTIPDISTGQLTTTKSRIVTPTAAVSNTIVTSNGDTTVTLTSTTVTLTYSAEPPIGTRFEYTLTGHTSDCTVTIPSTYSHALGAFRTSFIVPANKSASVVVKREATRYVMWGDPTTIASLEPEANLTTSTLIEIDQAAGSKKATLADVKNALAVGTKRTGSMTLGATATPVTLDFGPNNSYIYFVGGNATHNLPDAAASDSRALAYTFNGSYTITLVPDSNDYIRYGGTTLADAAGITITGTAGQTAVIVSDGGNWTTFGGSASYNTAP